jgi:hypothetical protein
MSYTNAQLDGLAKNINLDVDVNTVSNEKTFIEKFKEYWALIKPLLETAKIITGPKVDEVIDKIISVGEVIVGNAVGNVKAKLKEFTDYWPLVRMPINAIATLMPGKKGKAFRQFIKMADIFCEQYNQ